MKIDRTRPQTTGNAAPVRAAEAASRAYGAQDATASNAPRPTGDVATIAGLSDAELTPKVRQALDMLMNEVQSMRAELSQARKPAFCISTSTGLRKSMTPTVMLPGMKPCSMKQHCFQTAFANPTLSADWAVTNSV